ncbi:hypothetical protein [Crocosphaera sp. XPORK-15E]|uniref:hypothetical protein n=1 Tax=Crocosphaera sp. XPORK-15E TaxID=3110247 RepID=UPI002B213910|nr:hypothetical protein [Crocosphaera sp. XPORK-15E]MEA5533007.1 hypothetical protein [Crocosphaera sp. XPORK-15E]
MQVFFLITLAHLIEHMAQAWELWVMNWARPDCLGLLGLLSPWLMKSEWLHYGYALFMLIGLWALRPYIKSGKAYFWWSVALWFQFYHHIEHALLLGQKLFGVNFFNSPVPRRRVIILAPLFPSNR